MKAAGLTFSMTSWLAAVGTTEDGEEYVAEIYAAMAEDSRGNRWVHFMPFPGAVAHTSTDPEYGYSQVWFEDTREQSVAEVGRLLARLERAEELDDTLWHEWAPAYGSQAYQESEMFWVEREREEDRAA